MPIPESRDRQNHLMRMIRRRDDRIVPVPASADSARHCGACCGPLGPREGLVGAEEAAVGGVVGADLVFVGADGEDGGVLVDGEGAHCRDMRRAWGRARISSSFGRRV